MIAALVLVFVFAALMFLVLAFDNQRTLMRDRRWDTISRDHARRRRDRCLTVALVLLSVVLVLALAAVIL